MLLRSVLLRTHKNQPFANFCTFTNVESQSPEKGHVISYLISSCGLSPEDALSASKKVHFSTPDRPDAVLDFLEKHSFTKAQIAEFVRRRPRFLIAKPGTYLPKIEFLSRSLGIPENVVAATVSRYPTLLSRSLEHILAPNYNYLKDAIGAERVESLFKGGSWAFVNLDLEKVIPNVELLRGFEVPGKFIEFALAHYPEILGMKQDELREVVEEVKGMGFDHSKSTFVLAVHARMGKCNRALMERCCEIYRRWGWSEDDILMAFRRHPNCMVCSERKITKVLEFVVNELGREVRSLARYPNIFFFNMEKRTFPRLSVAHLLCLKGLLKKEWKFSAVLSPNEDEFLLKFVKKYDMEVPELYNVYASKKAKAMDQPKKAKAVEA